MSTDDNAKGGRLGRPPMPDHKRRVDFVKVYLTPSEKRALSRLADAEGVTLTEYARRRLKLTTAAFLERVKRT